VAAAPAAVTQRARAQVMSYFKGQRQTLMFSATMPMKIKAFAVPLVGREKKRHWHRDAESGLNLL